MARDRAFAFTINNPIESDEADILALKESAGYLVVGREIGDEGTPHFQGYVYFKEAKTFSSFKKKLPRAHIEIAKASPLDNTVYCSKQGDIFVLYGTIPRQGARNDIQQVVEKLQDGANMRSIVVTARSMQSIKVAEVYLKYFEAKRDWAPEVHWYYGPTGSGKTKLAYEWLANDDRYECMETGKWWDGYDAHEDVIIDELRDTFCTFNTMLRLLDRYPFRIETKGGTRQFLAKRIAITSPFHPRDVWFTTEDKNQLIRRIGEQNIFKVGEHVIREHVPEYDPIENKVE